MNGSKVADRSNGMTPGDIIRRDDSDDVYLVTRVTKKVVEGGKRRFRERI